MDLTFFAWADTHFGYNRLDADLRARIIAQLNTLPGTPYPAGIGGQVDEPAFVFHLGDIVDGVQPFALEIAHYEHEMPALKWPHREVLGNHERDAECLSWFRRKYGDLSYSFDCGGAHFVALASAWDGRYRDGQAGHVTAETLAWLRADLAAVAPGTSVIVGVHSRLDRFRNAAAVTAVLRDPRVVLVLAAHLHRPTVFAVDGIDCIDVGQCRDHPIDPPYGRNLYVVRIADGMLTALPWRWDLADWECGQGWNDPAATAARFRLRKRL